MLMIQFAILYLFCFIAKIKTVSIRRRKHLFGQQWDLRSSVPTEQGIGSTYQSVEGGGNIPIESSAIPSTDPNTITVQEGNVNENKKKRERTKSENPKPQKKSTEAAKAWHARKREAFLQGKPEAIEFYKKRNQMKAAKAREKTARIQDGTATINEQESYKHLKEKQKEYRERKRMERNAYLRKWRRKKKDQEINTMSQTKKARKS